MILLIKAIHIISAIVWVGALLALAKTMLIQVKASSDKSNSDSVKSYFGDLSSSIYKFYANPAMMLAFTAGTAMIVMNMEYMKQGWLHIKLLMLILLLVQHIMMKGQMKKINGGSFPSIKRLKVNILILILLTSAIVFMAVFSGGINWMYFGILMLVEFGAGMILINNK